MKTVYLNSNVLEEGVLLKALPDDIVLSAVKGKTSYGNNPAFPEFSVDSFVETLCQNRFESLRQTLSSIKSIDYIESRKPKEALAELILKLSKIEEPFREKLEKMAINFVIDTFGVPDDMIIFDCKIVNDIEFDMNVNTNKVRDYEYDSIEDAEDFRDEIYKRRIVNALCVGAGMEMSGAIKVFAGDLFEINPRLPEMYRDMILLNSYLLFSKSDIGISDDNKMQMGTVSVKFDGYDNKVLIKAQGKNFPVLVAETVRGLMELFASHGLPEDLGRTSQILQRSDYIEAEQWDMRIGPELWKMLYSYLEKSGSKMIPFVFKRICKLKTNDFNRLMKSVFGKTKEATNLMGQVISISQEDMEKQDTSQAKKQNIDKNVITDEYLHEEEL